MDPNEILKKDKTVKAATDKFKKKGKKKKPLKSNMASSAMTSDMSSEMMDQSEIPSDMLNVTIGEDGLPVENEELEESPEPDMDAEGDMEENKEDEDANEEEPDDAQEQDDEAEADEGSLEGSAKKTPRSPRKSKVSKSKGKKKKKPKEKIDIVNWKPSQKVKGKLVFDADKEKPKVEDIVLAIKNRPSEEEW